MPEKSTTMVEAAEMLVATKAALANAVKAEDRDGIRQAGEDLNGLGGYTLMKRILDEVANTYNDPEYGRVCSMIDHAWHGIGTWKA
jgi:hypothetical protein